MKLNIRVSYIATSVSDLELPIKSWNEVKKWYIKWDILHYTLDNETWNTTPLNSSTDEIIDWKRPDSACINDEFDNVLDSYG